MASLILSVSKKVSNVPNFEKRRFRKGPTLFQGLNEDDPDKHIEFCELYTIRQKANPEF